jgi:tetratricopeptide (TPR) repeat protein
MCALAVVLLVAAAGHAKSNKEALALYKQGLWDFRSGNVSGALQDFSAASQADPEFPQPIFATARIHQGIFESEMRNYGEAAEAYARLSDLLLRTPPGDINKDILTGYYFQGLLFLKGGDYANAVRSLEKFLEVYPDFEGISGVNNALGIGYYYLDQYDRAVSYFKRALDADQTNNEARFNLRSVYTRVEAFSEAMVLKRAGRIEHALKRLETLRDIAPRYISGRRLEANLLQELNRHEEAVRVFDEILGFEPDNLETYWMRIEMARSLILLHRGVEARSALLENLARFPTFEDQRARMEVVLLINKIGEAQ